MQRMQGVATSAVLVGATLGAAGAGAVSDAFGRKRVILVVALLFVLGAVGSAAAPQLWILLAGRAVVGVAIGIASMLTPLYLSEIAPKEKRGGIVSLNQFCITFGILVSYLVDYALAGAENNWRWMLGLGAVPGLILFLGMLTLPESPRWLAGEGRMDDARAALRRMRESGDVDAELAELRTDMRRDGRLVPWSVLLGPTGRRPLIVGVALAIFQQVTGINTVIYYAPSIFQSAGLSSASVAISGHGRGGAGERDHDRCGHAAIGQRWAAKAAAVGPGGHDRDAAGAGGRVLSGDRRLGGAGDGAERGGLCGILRHRAGAGVLAADIGNLSTGRARPRHERATVANWGSNFLVTLAFPPLVAWLGSAAAFLAFAVLSVGAYVFTWTMVPETRGRSLEEIEAALEGEGKLA